MKKLKMKKIMLGIGSVSLAIVPVAATVISCGETANPYKPDQDPQQTLLSQFIKSSKAPIYADKTPLPEHGVKTGVYFTINPFDVTPGAKNKLNKIMLLLSPAEARGLINEKQTELIAKLKGFTDFIGNLKAGKSKISDAVNVALETTWSDANWNPGDEIPTNLKDTIVKFTLTFKQAVPATPELMKTQITQIANIFNAIK